MQDFYKCQPGYEEKARVVAKKACKTLVHNMHYEARIQTVIDWHATYNGIVYKKQQARLMTLTWEQYLMVNTEHEYLMVNIEHEY
jgi:hypothetical protein